MTGKVFKMSLLPSSLGYLFIFISVVHLFSGQKVQADDEDDDETSSTRSTSKVVSLEGTRLGRLGGCEDCFGIKALGKVVEGKQSRSSWVVDLVQLNPKSSHSLYLKYESEVAEESLRFQRRGIPKWNNYDNGLRFFHYSKCPAVNSSNIHSNTDMLLRLAELCRYDRWTRPGSKNEPLHVHTRIYVYFLGSIEAHNLQFTAHILVRFRWRDSRLQYKQVAPNVDRVVGEGVLRNHIWVPHVYLVNEHESKMMGADQHDILFTVQPDGTILFSTRMKVTLFCLMNLQKFPFDQQECPLVLESWTYNMSELILQWEPSDPVIVNEHLHLTEYSLIRTWPNSTFVSYARPEEMIEDSFGSKSHYGKFSGNFSSLTVKFQLAREVGHYIMDYYVPSILLVVVSWVSFWLDPNAVPGRTTLGTSTMLTFITLTRNTGSSLPKVSYIKATEVWFIVCTAFIFGSLVEFAFVNTIWRRKQNIALKKVNSKYILKSTLTPQLHRKQFRNYMERCQSWPSVTDENDKPQENMFYLNNSNRNELTVNSIESINHNAFQSNHTMTTTDNSNDCQNVVIPIPTSPTSPTANQPQTKGFTTMTPQEIANWIDRRSRVFFPASFILFNILYWGFVWI